jgi:hypothetical protein
MVTKIEADILDSTATVCESYALYGDEKSFLSYVTSVKSKGTAGYIQVHIPGSIHLSQDAIEKITAWGVTNI